MIKKQISFLKYSRSTAQVCSSQRGGVLTESIIAVPVFLLLILIGIDLVRLTYINVAGQYALQRTARWALLGQQTARVQGDGSVKSLDRVTSIKDCLSRFASPLGLAVKNSAITVCPGPTPACSPESAGNPGELFVIRWEYDTKMIVFPTTLSFTFQALAENEKFK